MQVIEAMMLGISAKSQLEIRESIFELQRCLETAEQTDLGDLPVRHTFAPGVYAREMTIPEGVVVIGRIHRHAHVNVISQGKCRVLTEFGFETLEAPCTFVSQQGTKRVVVALDTVVWTTIHPTDSTDPDEIVQAMTADSYDDIEIAGEFRKEPI